MRSIRISDKSYDFLKKLSIEEHRSITGTLDLFISVFAEINESTMVGGIGKKIVSKNGNKKLV